MSSKSHAIPGIFTCLLASSLASQAVVLVNSNLDGASDSGFSSTSGKTIGFTLGSSVALGATGFSLDSIVVRLKTSATVPATTEYTFALYSNDGSTSPGTLLATFTSVPLTASTTTSYTLVPSTAFTLLPSTTYWIAATGTTANVVNWQFGGAASTVAAPGISFPSPVSYFGSGDPSGWSSGSSNYTDIQISATAVPEPSSSLAGLLAAGILAVRRRRA